MKTITSFFVAMFLTLSFAFAQNAAQLTADSIYVSTWKVPTAFFYPNYAPPAGGIESLVHQQIYAEPSLGFDAGGAIFDDEWAKIPGNGYTITHQNGNPASDHGVNDFKDASFKVLYDESARNIYILLQYTDDDVTGNETVEVMWSQTYKINGPVLKTSSANANAGAWYGRYQQFGAYKAAFGKAGYKNALIVNGSATGGTLSWSGTNADLTNGLFLDDFTVPGTNVVKQIITIGYDVLTGDARPDFSEAIWKTLNGEKGISFDIKVNDIDTDDATTADANGNKAAGYWWNATDNAGWAVTWYSGFIGLKKVDGLNDSKATNSIFGKITASTVQLTENADVTIFNSIGKLIKTIRNTNIVNISNMKSGIYLLKANNEVKKIAR